MPTITAANVASRISVPITALRDLASQSPGLYNVYAKQKSDGRTRTISEPLEPLKTLQSDLLRRLIACLPSDRDLRHVVLRNQVHNATTHVRQVNITKLDLRDAFPSVSEHAVGEALRRAGFNRDAARLVARLCTRDGELPQGAPTSNALLDLVMRPVDRAIQSYCRRNGHRYTRYADDLTLSGPDALDKAERCVERELNARNLFTNPDKTAHGGGKTAVLITGVMTAQTAKVRPQMLARTIQELQRAAATPDQTGGLASLRGSLGWIRDVNPRQAAAIIAQNVPRGTPVSQALALRKRKRRTR